MKRRILFLLCCGITHLGMAQKTQHPFEWIKSLRSASNAAIAAHDIGKLSEFLLEDAVLVRGNSTQAVGKDRIMSEWKKLFTDNPKVLFIRTPTEIVISSSDTLAWETGTWKAEHSYSNGGNYSAMWKKRGSSWKLQAELFVALW